MPIPTRSLEDTEHAIRLLRRDAQTARAQGRDDDADRIDRRVDLLLDDWTEIAGCDR